MAPKAPAFTVLVQIRRREVERLNKQTVLRVLASGTFLGLTAGCVVNPSLPDPLAAGWQGRAVCEHLHEDSQQRILRCTFDPGVGHERHYHRPHFGYALSGGRMRITDGEGVRELDLDSGSSYRSEGTAWHEVLNVGDTTVRYLLVERK